jgi:hypothetical protein
LQYEVFANSFGSGIQSNANEFPAKGFSIARTGDPNGLFTPPGGVTASPVSPVPEPGSWLLLGIGLAGFGFATLQKSNSTRLSLKT